MYDEEYEYQRPRRQGSLFGTIVVATLTSVAVFFGLRYLEQSGYIRPTANATVEVPNIVGLPAADAKALLASRGLLLVLEAEREDARVRAGSVSAQKPLPGSYLRRDSTVGAVISRGLTQVAVPNVVGGSVENAGRYLAAAALRAGATKSAASDAPPGTVIATTPPAGTILAPHSAVELTVSAGRPMHTVPKLIGLRVAEAKAAATRAGLTTGKIRYEYDSERRANVVLRQSPAQGTQAAPGSAIDLVVNE